MAKESMARENQLPQSLLQLLLSAEAGEPWPCDAMVLEASTRTLNSLTNHPLRHLRFHQFTELAFNSHGASLVSSATRYLNPRCPTRLLICPPTPSSTLHFTPHSRSRAKAKRQSWRRRGLSLRASCSRRWPRRPSSAWSGPGPARRRRVRSLVCSFPFNKLVC